MQNFLDKFKRFTVRDSVRFAWYNMPYLKTVSYSIWVSGGIVADNPKKLGTSLFLPEITMRGNSSHNAQESIKYLDSAGASHSESASLDAFVYQGTATYENIGNVLSEIFRSLYEPTLPEDEVDNIREVLLQDLKAIEDNPQRLVINKLIEKYHKAPFNRCGDGTKEGIEATTIDDIKEIYNKYYGATDVLIVLAGNDSLKEHINTLQDLFNKMKVAKPIEKLVCSDTHTKNEYYHVDYSSEQTQIALASPAPNALSDDYYVARVTSELLSGGMFGRLFSEVREKRGLVYSVYNRYVANQYYGKNVLYAGTTPKNAKETLDVSLETIRTLGDNLTEDELTRAKNSLKALILIQGESSLSRAASVAYDMWLFDDYREKDFMVEKINAVTLDDVKAYINKYPYENYTLVSLGKNEISGIN